MNKRTIESLRNQGIADAAGPGKFEGEPIYASYIWDCALGGCSEDVGDGIYRVELSVADKIVFPELGDASSVLAYECDNGFVLVQAEDREGN